jgi:hypothetical protein
MGRLSVLILVFSVLFLFFFIGLVFLDMPFALYPLMSVQDVVDVLTSLVLLPLYFLLFRIGPQAPFKLCGLIVFVIFAAFWAAGQGMHLSANSINNLLCDRGMETGDVYKLTYFYDETLGHYLWHAGIVGLSALLIYRQWRNPFTEGKALLWPLILGGIIYGFSYFLIIMEGNTAPLGVTFSVLATGFILIWDRRGMGRQPLVLFSLVGYGLAMLLFLIWGIINGGLPPIMDVIKI